MMWPAVLLWRGQAAGLHKVPKQRVIWAMDHAETIISLAISRPLMEVLRRRPEYSAWNGPEHTDVAVTYMIQESIRRESDIHSVDVSGFDQSVGESLLMHVWEWIQTWVLESGPLVRILQETTANIGLVTPLGIERSRGHGIPSGSGLTSLLGTLAMRLVVFAVARWLGTEVVSSIHMGDDALILFKDRVTPEQLADAFKVFGLKYNAPKSGAAVGTCHFLQRWYSYEYRIDGVCRGVRSINRTITGLSGYERFHREWSPYLDAVRWVSQAENCRWHPNFKRFVEWIIAGVPLLQSDMPMSEIVRRAGGAEEVSSRLGFRSYGTGRADPVGINKFEFTRIRESSV